MVRGGDPERGAPARPLIGKWLVWACVLAGIAVFAGMVVGFGKVGRKPFVRGATLAEARNAVAAFGERVARCAADSGRLPEAAEGPPPGCPFEAAETAPKLRFAWRVTGATEGNVHAYGDLDGDGHEDTAFTAVVRCERAPDGPAFSGCWLGPVVERPDDAGP